MFKFINVTIAFSFFSLSVSSYTSFSLLSLSLSFVLSVASQNLSSNKMGVEKELSPISAMFMWTWQVSGCELSVARKLFKWNSYVSSCQFLALLIFLACSFWRLPNLLHSHSHTLTLCAVDVCSVFVIVVDVVVCNSHSFMMFELCTSVLNILRIFQVFMLYATRWCIAYKCIFNVSSFMSIFVSCSLQNENNTKKTYTRSHKRGNFPRAKFRFQSLACTKQKKRMPTEYKSPNNEPNRKKYEIRFVFSFSNVLLFFIFTWCRIYYLVIASKLCCFL